MVWDSRINNPNQHHQYPTSVESYLQNKYVGTAILLIWAIDKMGSNLLFRKKWDIQTKLLWQNNISLLQIYRLLNKKNVAAKKLRKKIYCSIIFSNSIKLPFCKPCALGLCKGRPYEAQQEKYPLHMGPVLQMINNWTQEQINNHRKKSIKQAFIFILCILEGLIIYHPPKS